MDILQTIFDEYPEPELWGRIDWLSEVRELCVAGSWKAGATLLQKGSKTNKKIYAEEDGQKFVRNYFFNDLLEQDRYMEASALAWSRGLFEQRPKHILRIFKALSKHDLIILLGASGLSKCLGPEVPVLMFDGTIKPACEVKVGDQLMGDDSKPRNVLSAHSGFGPMFRIKPKRGESWTCNDQHILTLRCNHDKKNGNGSISSKWFKGNIVDVPLYEYLGWSKTRQNLTQQFSVGVEFEKKYFPFSPYAYGLWIADGGVDLPVLHKPDGNPARYWRRYFEELGYRINSIPNDRDTCTAWFVRIHEESGGGDPPNPFTEFVRSSFFEGEKRIRHEYLTGSREQRLQLLAGLVDGDGTRNGRGYAITTKYPGLAKDLCFLARSLGLSATDNPLTATIKETGFIGEYRSVWISGDTHFIPSLAKPIEEGTVVRDCTNTSFEVEEIGDGEYFGFEIDGNRRFLLGDFTVTHNTYCAAAYCSLDFMRDPENTSIKFGSVNDTNLKGNLWANLRTFQEQSLFPQDLHPNETRMRMKPLGARPDCGIDAVLFSKQRDSTGKIKGFHPKPFRLKKHPKYGDLTVVRILLDETQELSPGVQSDLGSPQSTIDEDTHHMKIMLTCNPIDEGKWVVQMAQPRGGWEEEKINKLKDWESNGWHVVRLDGADFENVRFHKTVFPGFLTRKAYDGYMNNGLPTPNWYIFARGYPPPGRAQETVVPSSWFDSSKGEPMFVGATSGLLGGDLAFVQDKAILTIGRYGLASGWTDWDGVEHRFNSRNVPNQWESRHCGVLDRIITLQTDDNDGVAGEVKSWAEAQDIEPNFCVLDMTGNGFGVVSHLQKKWGPVEGVNWKEKATDLKILVEDKFAADLQTKGKVSEMYWTVRRWMDPRVRGLFINPTCDNWEVLRRQLTTRAYKQAGMQIEVESKENYCKRFPQSPDEADSFVMMMFGARIRGLPLPALVDENAIVDRGPGGKQKGVLKTADRPHSASPTWATPRLENVEEARLPSRLAS